MIWDKELGGRRRKVPLEVERLVEDMLTSQAPHSEEEEPDIQMQEEGTAGFICFFALFNSNIDSLDTAVAEVYQETVEIIENLDEVRSHI